jgi:outer membrane protein OmpA-like peptidoglycan-associated protein
MSAGAVPCLNGPLLRALHLATLALLGACTHVTERVVLLPQPNAPTGAVEVRHQPQPRQSNPPLRLDRPYAVAELAGDALRPANTDAAEVRQRYGALLAFRPPAPERFVLRFEVGSDRLTPESQAVLASIRAALQARPAPELAVTGHTDRVGSLEANDRLALARAEAVREMLVSAGVPRQVISVAGRGEREPEVPTADEVAEPRNRRVEVKLR